MRLCLNVTNQIIYDTDTERYAHKMKENVKVLERMFEPRPARVLQEVTPFADGAEEANDEVIEERMRQYEAITNLATADDEALQEQFQDNMRQI